MDFDNLPALLQPLDDAVNPVNMNTDNNFFGVESTRPKFNYD